MRILGLNFIIALQLLWAGAVAANPQSPGAVSFEFGYFCAMETVDTQVADDTISGVVNLVDGLPNFIRQTTIIPAKIGVGFGVQVEVAPNYAGQATVVTVHPPMGERNVTRESWQTHLDAGDPSYNGFTFEYDYELALGPWSLSATRDGRLIYKVDFLVVDPSNLPPIACGRALMS